MFLLGIQIYWVVLCTVCVLICIVLVPSGVTTPAVNKNIISYHTIGIVIICHRLDPSGRSMVLGSAHRLTESSASDIPWRVKQKSLSCPLKGMPVVSHRRCRIFGQQKNSFPLMIIGPQLLGCPAHSRVNILTELPGSIIFVTVNSIFQFFRLRKTYRQSM